MKPEQAMDTLVGIGFSYAAHINGSIAAAPKVLPTKKSIKMLEFAASLNEAADVLMKYRTDTFGKTDTEHLKSVIDKMGGSDA